MHTKTEMNIIIHSLHESIKFQQNPSPMELMVSLLCDILSVLVCHPIPQVQTECTLFQVISAILIILYV